jgi:hypothetical protein
MKFEEKYELLESVTTGKVETFVANDKVRGERVLVHILHCDPQKPNLPTVQWVLESFRRVAPEPAALVLETGRYGGTLYAYLVTKMPEKTVLRGWVERYNAQAKETQEILIPDVQSTAESETATAEIKPAEPARVPVQFTQVFREFESQPTPSVPVAPVKETGLPPRPLPHLGAGANPSAPHPAIPWDEVLPPTPVPSKGEPRISSSAVPTSPDFPAQSFRVETAEPGIGDSTKAGEFTSFFQGPFHVEGPSEIPAVSPRETELPRKSVGAFTALFGTPQAERSQPSSGGAASDSPASGSSSGFTGLFGDSEILSPKSPPTPPTPPAGLPRAVSDAPPTPSVAPKEPHIASLPASPLAPTPAVFTTLPPPIPVLPKPPAVTPTASAPDGATRVFSPPTPTAPASEPLVASGPSPYTQIISVRPPRAGGEAGSQKQAPAQTPGAGLFPAPSMPAFPTIAPPPMPPAPVMPKLAVPPPPSPKLPKVEPSKPPVSFWPLAIVLTVLLFIGVLLVLYFALKH